MIHTMLLKHTVDDSYHLRKLWPTEMSNYKLPILASAAKLTLNLSMQTFRVIVSDVEICTKG